MSRSPVPKYRRASNGQAFVQNRSIKNKAHRLYLGKFGTPGSLEKYQQFIKRLAAGDDLTPARPLTSTPTVDALIDSYFTFAENYYRRAEGMSPEFDAMLYATKPLHELFGSELAASFGPRSLVTIRTHLAKHGLARTNINRQIPRIRKFWRWCCEQEHVDPALYHRLLCVRGLAKGQDGVRESKPVQPASTESLAALLPHLSPVVRAMAEIQYRCGMRPSEVCRLRTCDLDMSDDVWLYMPARHKTEHLDITLIKAIPPTAQRTLRPWLENEPYCFPPYRRRTPKQNARRKSRLRLHDRYSAESYRKAFDYGFAKARKAGVEIPHFSPNQLRHSILTYVSEELGKQAAQRWGGHESIKTTSIYVKARASELITIARQLEERWKACG